jgi:hypothetical protein
LRQKEEGFCPIDFCVNKFIVVNVRLTLA